MTNESQRPSVARTAREKEVEQAKGRVIAAAVDAAKAREAEAWARTQIATAQQTAKEAAEALGTAIRAEEMAKAALVQARDRAKQATRDAERALDTKTGTDKEMQRANEQLRALQAKAAKRAEEGKRPDTGTIEKAVQEALKAEETGRTVLQEAAEAKERAELARTALQTAEAAATNALAEVARAREAERTARQKIAQAEEDWSKTAKEARRAGEAEARANREMQRAMDRSEAGPEKAPPPPKQEESPLPTPSATVVVAERQEKQSDKDDVVEEQQIPALPSDELFSGVVTVSLVRPVHAAQLKALKDGLARAEGVRVNSVGGSAEEGVQIILSLAQPLPLLSRLSAWGTAERVTRRGRNPSVTLKLN